MPIYEYQCRACEYEFERLQKLSDDALIDCPECGKPQLRKKISAAGFRLSGGGWYETDFKKGGKQKNLAGERDGSSAKTESKGDSSKSDAKASSGKTESKPAPAAKD